MSKSAKAITSAEFDTRYAVLNAAQKKAVDTIEGPVLVIAGPGTGKTTILTLRIANIIRTTDTAPENILALTFTESGAYAMRRKLLEIIGPAAYKVNIHTFHGFAEKIIQEYPDYFSRIIGSSIITDAEQIKIVEKIIQSPKIDLLRPYGDPVYYVKPALQEIHTLKRENISPEEFKKSIERDILLTKDIEKKTELEKAVTRNEKNTELAYVYEKYEAELAKQKYYDFEDMLLELIKAMEGRESKEKYTERPALRSLGGGGGIFKLMLQEAYQYILADEHQDANAAQNKILELLADFHDSPNLFIVGDDKQAIYRFQGASLENFLYFSKKYPDAVVIPLEHNYRSHQGILDASHGVIANNPTLPGHGLTKLLSLQVGTKPIYIDEFATMDEELEYLAVVIERLIKKGESAEEIAILYRENKQAQAVSNFLRIHAIPHRIESDHNVLDDIDAVKIVLLCRAIHDPSDSDMLARALLLPEMGCDSADVAEVCKRASRERVPLHEVIKSLVRRGHVSPPPAHGARTDMSSPHLVTPPVSDEIKTAYDRIISWSGDAQTVPFPNLLQRLIQETNMLGSIMASADSLERLSSLEAFFSKVSKAAQSKKTFYLKDFIEYIDIVSDHGLMTKRSYTEHTGGVRLMTAHRSKGLEFNHVFMVHTVDGSWGNRNTRNKFKIPAIEHARDQGRIEDERRLFYVAMTRARESVTISYARSNGDKETIPSQFVAEIEPDLVSFEKPSLIESHDVFVKKLQAPTKTTVSILNPEFVRSKFLSQPLSVTHLNNYLKCPWEYFFVNLIRVPQAQTKHQMYGTAIHAALRAFFDAYKEEHDMTKKQLVDLFKYHLESQPMSINDREESFEKGKNALEGYLKTYSETWNRNLFNEYGVKGVEIELSKKEKLQLTGKIDKIELVNGSVVNVVDYKTAKPKSRNEIEGKTKDADGNYKRQLVFYKLLLDADNKYSMKTGEIDFIEPNDRGIYKKESFEITSEEVSVLKDSIKKAAEEIINLSFINSTCSDKKCQYCKLGQILRG